MKKRIICTVSAVTLVFCTLFSAFASSWNGEGTGGEIGSAISNTYIVNAATYTGIRVSIVDNAGARVEGTVSVDYMWNVSGGANAYHFAGKRNKIEYRAFKNANEMNLVAGGYTYRNANEFASLGAACTMPRIVLHSGSNILEIRDWLTDEFHRSVPNKIAKDCGLSSTAPYEGNADNVNLYRNTMCKHNYHILIEPVGSVVVQGVPCVGTATELAFLGQLSGCAWTYLGTYIDMQLPLSMYLSYTQLGIPAASFSATRQTREDVITYLGCAITSYHRNGDDTTDDPYEPDDDPQPAISLPPATYGYRVSTDVYSSVKITNVSGTDIIDNGWVEFSIPSLGKTYRMDGIALPEGGSQLAYCSWKTPSSPGTLEIAVTCSEGIGIETRNGIADTFTIRANVSGYAGIDPPDTSFSDEMGSWTYPSGNPPGLPSNGNTWGHWEYTYETGDDREIDVWHYHEHGSQTFHRTGNQLVSSNRIENSSYYRFVSAEHHDAEYEYGPWIQHTDEPWSDPGEGFDIDGAPVNTRSVVTYLGPTPYYTRMRHFSRTLDWGPASSAGTAMFPHRNPRDVYYVFNGTEYGTCPSPAASGQTLIRYEYLGAVSDDHQVMYRYRKTTFVSQAGTWSWTDTDYLYTTRNYEEETFTIISPTAAVQHLTIRTDYSTKTYYGADAASQARSDTAIWSRMVSCTDYYTWRERTVTTTSESYDTYVYDMYDTSWNDSGSYWSTGSYVISTQRKSWKWIEESASAVTAAVITPDGRCPTDYEENGVTYMKSGYGINLRFTAVITTLGKNKNGSTAVTSLQRVESWFPEFGFTAGIGGVKYRRVLEYTGRGPAGEQIYEFPRNKYSRLLSRVHFTPLWYPDGTPYAVWVRAYDLWTPAGQISVCAASDPIMIADGSMYDDWAIGLYSP